MKRNFKRRLTSMLLVIVMIAGMVPLSVMPSSPVSMTVGAATADFQNSNWFAPGGHIVLVNGITAEVIAFNPGTGTANVLNNLGETVNLAARTMQVKITGTPTRPTRVTAANTNDNAANNNRGDGRTAPQTSDTTGTGASANPLWEGTATQQLQQGLHAYMVYARSDDSGGVKQGPAVVSGSGAIANNGLISAMDVFYTAATPTEIDRTITLQFGTGIQEGTLRLYIGMRSTRLTISPGGGTASHNAIYRYTNAFTMNGILVRTSHVGVSEYSSLITYQHIGSASVGGSMTTWFESDSTALGGRAPTASTGNAAGGDDIVARSNSPQIINSAFYYAGDAGFGAGNWAMNLGRPGAIIVRAEFTGLPVLGSEEEVEGVTYKASGILNTGGKEIYAITVDLDGVAARSGNYKLEITGLPTTDGYLADGETSFEPKIFHYDAGDEVERRIKYEVTRTGNDGIDVGTLSSALNFDLVFYPDTEIKLEESDAPDVKTIAEGSASLNYDAKMVTITAKATPSKAGTYIASVTGNSKFDGLNLNLDDRIFKVENATDFTQELKWVFEYDDLDIESLDLGLNLKYYADSLEETTTASNGITATGVAVLNVNADAVDISVNLGGTLGAEKRGNYFVKIIAGSETVGERAFYIDNSIPTNTYRLFLDNFGLDKLSPESWDDLNLSLTGTFIQNLTGNAPGLPGGAVDASLDVRANYDTGEATATITLGGATATQSASGNYRVGLRKGSETIGEDRVVYYEKDSGVNRTFTYTFPIDTVDNVNGNYIYNVFDSLGLAMSIVFGKDAVITGSGKDGLLANGTASLSYDSGLVNARITVSGNAKVGAYRVALKDEDNTEIGTRTFRFATADSDFKQSFSVPIDATEEQLKSLKIDDIGLSLEIRFIEPGPITANNPSINGVTVRGMSTHDAETKQWSVTISVSGTAEESGNHYVNLTLVDEGEHYYYVKENASLTRTLTFTGNADVIPQFALTHTFHPDEPITATRNEEAEGNGVTASAIVSKNYDQNSATVVVTVAGTAKDSGNYRLSFDAVDIGAVTDEDRVFRSESIPTNTIRYTIESIDGMDFDVEDLTLTLDFFPDFEFYDVDVDEDENETKKPFVVGDVVIKGGATLAYSSETLTINLGLTASEQADNGKATYNGAGTYRISVTYEDNKNTEYRLFHFAEGAKIEGSIRYTIDGVKNLDLSELGLGLVVEFYPDIFDTINGILATGRVSIYDDEAVIDVELTTPDRDEDIDGYVDATGYYTLSLKAGMETVKTFGSETKRYFEDSTVRDSISFRIKFEGEVTEEALQGLYLSWTFASDTSFIYEIDYYEEMIVFGGTVDYGKDVLYALVKDTSKFNVAKAKWMPTLGRINVSKLIPKNNKKGPFNIALKYVGNNEAFIEQYKVDDDGVITEFAFDAGTGDFTGKYIQLKARPDVKTLGLKEVAKTFYDYGKMEFKNTSNETLEVLFGLDKGKKLDKIKRYGKVFTEELEKDEVYPFDADKLPAGTPGIIRVAPVNFVSTEIDGGEIKPLDAEKLKANYTAATFASAPVKFKVAAQPKAPKNDKMGIIEKKGVFTINAINEKMGIVFKTETKMDEGGNPKVERTWNDTSTALKKAMTVKEFDAMLESSGVKLADHKDGDNYVFEIRLLATAKKLMSAKTTLVLKVSDYEKALSGGGGDEGDDEPDEPNEPDKLEVKGKPYIQASNGWIIIPLNQEAKVPGDNSTNVDEGLVNNFAITINGQPYTGGKFISAAGTTGGFHITDEIKIGGISIPADAEVKISYTKTSDMPITAVGKDDLILDSFENLEVEDKITP